MARRATFPPKIQHHQASGQARVRVCGQDYYLGVYGTPEAEQAYARLVAELTAGRLQPKAAGRTVEQLIAEWDQQMARRYAATSREPPQFRKALEVVLRLYGSRPATEFDTLALMAVQQAMVQQGWCRNVVNRQIVRVRTVWRWAEARKLVPLGTWASLLTVEGLRRNDPSVRHTAPQEAASWEEFRAVLRQCSGLIKAMLLLQWWSGCRSCEVRLMCGEQIDRRGPVWYYRPPSHKMSHKGQERVIPLGRKCQAVLQRFQKAQGMLFLTRRGQPYTAFSYAQAVRRAAARAGVVGFHPYRARHAAKQRLTRQFGLDAARAVLGQKSLGTTNGYASQQDLRTATEVAGQAC